MNDDWADELLREAAKRLELRPHVVRFSPSEWDELKTYAEQIGTDGPHGLVRLVTLNWLREKWPLVTTYGRTLTVFPGVFPGKDEVG